MYRKKQSGLTLGDMLTWCIILGTAALGVMRVFPIYNQKLKVDASINSILENPELNTMNQREIAAAMMRNFSVQDVDVFDGGGIKDALNITPIKGGKGRLLTMQYEIRGPLFGKFELAYQYYREATLPSLDYQ